jgi:hypothetical protein
MQDAKGVVPDASAPLPDYPVGAKVAQFSLMISPLPAGATAGCRNSALCRRYLDDPGRAVQD